MTNMNAPIVSISGKTLTGYHLKMIALFTMLIDHVGAVLLYRYIVDIRAYNDALLIGIYELMRYVGRMAFPLYCFLLVEGFRHTKNVGKYALRLGVFALISEIPFDLAISGKIWDPSHNNVFLTLLIGLLLIWGISYVEKFYAIWREKELDVFIGTLLTITLGILLVAVGAFLAEEMLHTDYGMGGVFTILVFYLLRFNRQLAYIAAVMVLYIFAGSSEIMALLMIFPLSMYDGSRGKQTKYLYYAFYPGHLLVLAVMCMLLGI